MPEKRMMRMKILHIYDDYGSVLGGGSAPTVVINISKQMVKLGYEVTIIERKNGEDNRIIDGIRFVRVKARKRIPCPLIALNEDRIFGSFRFILDCIEFAVKVNKYLKKIKDDFAVIHVHFPFATSVLVTMSRKLRKRMIYTAHIGEEGKRLKLSSDTPLPLKIFSPDLYLMRRVRRVVVLNESLRAKLIKKGINEEKIVVIPNGVEANNFGNFSESIVNKIKEKYGMKGKITVMFAGSITPRKGVDYLIRAAEMIIQDGYANVLFLLVGSQEYDKEFASRVARYVKNKSLDKNIKFAGFVPYEDLKVLYQACDIFVLPSFGEGDPIALKEALASGKPLIGTKVGGIPAQIKDGWNGFLVEPGNEKQLAEKIRYLIDNPEERERMGENSRKLAREEFDWKKIAERYLKVYEEVAE